MMQRYNFVLEKVYLDDKNEIKNTQCLRKMMKKQQESCNILKVNILI